ncbi:hypothetical protein I4U23_024860 [Adineta vaga]|nr:hypothetical protein I4U23_024860 [Adineta vaga]
MPPNMYPQPPPTFFQPSGNPNSGPGYLPQPPAPLPISRPSRNLLPNQHPSYKPRFHSQPRHRTPVRVHHRQRSRRCRPVIHIIESDSCSSLSTCSSISSCSRYYRRSHSCPRRSATGQQPIIFLPVQCQQQPSAITCSNQGQAQSFVLPSIPLHQSNLALPSASTMQPAISMPHILSNRKPQQYQAGPIQYVQATPRSSSSQLRSIPVQSRSTAAQQSVLVDSTNKKQSIIIKPIPRACSSQNLPQNDMKFRRYESNGEETFTKDNAQIEQRRETHFL